MSSPSAASEPEQLLAAAAAGDRLALARLLSAVERGGPRGRAVAGLAYRSGKLARTVGITGAPGAGKSTLTSRLVSEARRTSPQVGVVAVDPSSPYTGGAILGDRVRMQDHALDDGVYIRSLATRGHLGGLTVAVPEALRVLSAVGIPLVLVETVGVGQVEVEVASATDTTVVVVNPRWGDAVQANKAGLLEVADVFAINKADLPGARDTRRDLEQMLDMGAGGPWRPPVVETVSSSGEGVSQLWEAIGRHHQHLADSGQLHERRHQRLEQELRRVLAVRIGEELDRVCAGHAYQVLADQVAAHHVDPYEAAGRLLVHVGAPAQSQEGTVTVDPTGAAASRG